MLKGVTWYTERSISEISLGGLLILVVIRTIQYNMFKMRVSVTLYINFIYRFTHLQIAIIFFSSLLGQISSYKLFGSPSKYVCPIHILTSLC